MKKSVFQWILPTGESNWVSTLSFATLPKFEQTPQFEGYRKKKKKNKNSTAI
jgi:hypothetical protein